MNEPVSFSSSLGEKIKRISSFFKPVTLGSLTFPSPFVQAPMAGICSIPYRLLMEDLGAGFTISELVSCHGINHGNQRTLDMLKIHPREKNIGLQLFGEDPREMAKAAKVMETYQPLFIDINMGCPVRKVVTKGGGAALLQSPEKLRAFFLTIREAISIPLTIKIRTGWDEENKNAQEVIQIAKDSGIEWVSIHGRTRSQKYMGLADWPYLEKIAKDSPLPIIGNGDLHSPSSVALKSQHTNCQALMIARGSIRNPFIFLESYIKLQPKELQDIKFSGEDYREILHRLFFYTMDVFSHEKVQLVQMRKFMAWFASGFKGAAAFRANLFRTKNPSEAKKLCDDYFLGLSPHAKKQIPEGSFMTSGHG